MFDTKISQGRITEMALTASVWIDYRSTLRSEGSHQINVRLWQKTHGRETLSYGVCILPRLADGEPDHLLRLGGIKL